uniref:Uncharacterized protein n=1 Tax=Rhizophora mucronata TaxID=61149 RepID=A0A2P2N1C2_RHIMU
MPSMGIYFRGYRFTLEQYRLKIYLFFSVMDSAINLQFIFRYLVILKCEQLAQAEHLNVVKFDDIGIEVQHLR